MICRLRSKLYRKETLHESRAGFPNLDTVDFWARSLFVGGGEGGNCSVHHRMLSGTTGLCPLVASSTLPRSWTLIMSLDVPNHLPRDKMACGWEPLVYRILHIFKSEKDFCRFILKWSLFVVSLIFSPFSQHTFIKVGLETSMEKV